MYGFNQFFFKEIRLFKRTIPFIDVLWFVLGVMTTLVQFLKNSFNNYLIFRGVFWHALKFENLYANYPAEYFDVNHYGPFFSIVIGPFALLPVKTGMILWGIANCAFLYYAIRKLPFNKNERIIVLWVCLLEQLTALHNQQFNHATAALIILSYVFISEKKDFWAALCIIAGIAIKLYGIVGLAFFFMSGKKSVFTFSCIFWAIIIFCVPMLISSPGYIVNSYSDWYHCLLEKNRANLSMAVSMQDISVGGMIKRLSNNFHFNDLIVLVVAALSLLFEMCIAIFSYTQKFWMLLLSSLLLSIVLFSSSSESGTYIIGLPGVAIWYIISERDYPKASLFFLVLVILFTSISSTDLVPHYIKTNYIIGYSLKALPCFFIWLFIFYQMISQLFVGKKSEAKQLIGLKL